MLSSLAPLLFAVLPSTIQVQESSPELQLIHRPGADEIHLADGSLLHVGSGSISGLRRVDSGRADVFVALWSEQTANGVVQRYRIRPAADKPFGRVRDVVPTVDLQRGSFDPLLGLAPATVEGLEGSGQLFIVQFHTQGIEAYREALRVEGAEVKHFMPHQSHVVRMDDATAARVGELPMVRWVGPYRASYRLEHEVLLGMVEGDLPTQRYYVQVLDKGPRMKGLVASRLRGLGAVIEALISDGYRLEATMTADQVRQAAAWDEVFWIDRWSAPEEDMNKVRSDGGANAVETIAGFTGTGVRAECMDGNLDFGHQDLQSNPVIAHGNSSGSNTHGTPVTGIVFGDGTGNPTRRGLLPDGQGIFASYGSLGNRYTHTAQLLAAPYFAVFQTNSWGGSLTSTYNSTSMQMDDILFDNDIVIFQSQSNTGNTASRPQAWAKNIVSVGGIRHQDTLNTNDDSWSSAGSIGPASDGRIKPDLSYWYDSILAPQAGGGQTQFGGTSAATPMTAGYFGLMYEMWHAGIFGNTPGATVFDSRPKATTARALMINTAARYDFNGQSADLTRTHQGWGRANVETLYNARDEMFIVNEEDVLTELGSAVYPVAVDANTPMLAVTLVYLDLPGTTSSSIHRINDLSLRVTSPGGIDVYWGNNGLRNDNTSETGGNSNTKDPIENVFIENPEAGTWTIEVFADEINQDGHVETPGMDVDFSLVVRGTSGLGGTPCLSPVIICDGAPNSFSAAGTTLQWQGGVSVSTNDLVFIMGGLPANEFGLWFYGTAPNNAPVGNGTICVGGTLYRLAPIQSDFLGTFAYPLDLTAPPEPAAQIMPGATWYFQFWYRDPNAGGANFNFSDALSVTFCD